MSSSPCKQMVQRGSAASGAEEGECKGLGASYGKDISSIGLTRSEGGGAAGRSRGGLGEDGALLRGALAVWTHTSPRQDPAAAGAAFPSSYRPLSMLCSPRQPRCAPLLKARCIRSRRDKFSCRSRSACVPHSVRLVGLPPLTRGASKIIRKDSAGALRRWRHEPSSHHRVCQIGHNALSQHLIEQKACSAQRDHTSCVPGERDGPEQPSMPWRN